MVHFHYYQIQRILILPVVGVPLPLVSQGGTSLVTLMMGFGILMAISTEQRRLAH